MTDTQKKFMSGWKENRTISEEVDDIVQATEELKKIVYGNDQK